MTILTKPGLSREVQDEGKFFADPCNKDIFIQISNTLKYISPVTHEEEDKIVEVVRYVRQNE